MYTFTFGIGSINVTGSGTLQAGEFNGMISMDQTPPKANSFNDIVVFEGAEAFTGIKFKALVSEINHPLGPGATATDVIAWILNNTSAPTSPVSNEIPFGDGVATDFTLNHGLNSTRVMIQIRETAGTEDISFLYSIQRIDNNNMRVFGFATPPALNEFTAVFIKG